mmetsp:Transcript_17173/g.36920  ORF Transcript_17173/g.36920 Transcript_17173/m.36920 type:complete len:220 (-) Transcript_17173:657-1316(-)
MVAARGSHAVRHARHVTTVGVWHGRGSRRHSAPGVVWPRGHHRVALRRSRGWGRNALAWVAGHRLPLLVGLGWLLIGLGRVRVGGLRLRLGWRSVKNTDVQCLPRLRWGPAKHLTHLHRRRVVDSLAEDGGGGIIVEQCQEAHRCCEAARVREELGVLGELGVEEGVGLVEASHFLQNSHLLNQILEGQFVGPRRGHVRVRPDSDSLGEVLGTDVTDHR